MSAVEDSTLPVQPFVSAPGSLPVLSLVRKQLIKNQPFAGLKFIVDSPIDSASATFASALRDGGAQVSVCPGEPASLDDTGGLVFGDSRFLASLPESLTLTGAILTDSGKTHPLPFPVFSVADTPVLRLFELKSPIGQDGWDAMVSSLNLFVAGLRVVVLGFGRTGRSIAARAQAAGAAVLVTEVDPLRALEAATAGYRVLPVAEAALVGDVFVTASGCRSVIGREHFDKLRDGAILCNAGTCDTEIDLPILFSIAGTRRRVSDTVEEISMRDGRRVCLVNGGLPPDPACSRRLPAALLDLSFAIQALTAEYLVKNRSLLENVTHPVPSHIDRQVASLKLEALSIHIDRLTVEQEQHLFSRSQAFERVVEYGEG